MEYRLVETEERLREALEAMKTKEVAADAEVRTGKVRQILSVRMHNTLAKWSLSVCHAGSLLGTRGQLARSEGLYP
jgi:hypothetical protein